MFTFQSSLICQKTLHGPVIKKCWHVSTAFANTCRHVMVSVVESHIVEGWAIAFLIFNILN